MGISEKKMQIVINNYFKQECDVNTSIREAFEKGFRIGVKKGQSAQPEQKWIPCSERFPKEGQKCLVYDKAIGFRVDTYIGHGNPYNWELFVRDYEAWIPIPKLTGGDVE